MNKLKLTLLFLFGISLGIYLSEFTSVYRLTCDSTKYGWEWTTQHRLDREPFICRDSNQLIEREKNPYMISQLIYLEIREYFYNED
jgi:hypothetical protein